MGLLSYNWYYPGIVLTIFNRKQFIYNISTITCKSHGARSTCVTAITCVRMINCVWTYVPQLNLSIYILYLCIKEGRGQKAHIFNLSAERIQTLSVSECFNICADQNWDLFLCPLPCSPAALFGGEWWSGGKQSPPPDIVIVIVCVQTSECTRHFNR